MQRRGGFTLIELLVVIAIIGLLSSVVLASLNTARAKARDAKRMSDLREMRTALELYYDEHQKYPIHTSWMFSNASSWNTLASDLSQYMQTLPVDPRNTSTTGPWVNGDYVYAYVSDAGGTKYDLVAQFEEPSNPNRCAVRGWLYHYGGDRPWCAGFPNSYTYSPYLYADH